GSLVIRTERVNETYKNVSQDIRDQLNAEAEAVQIILTGIDNDIYSTVDACSNACEMWKAIERSQQAATRNRGKATVNTPQPIYDQEPSMVDEDDETSKDKEIDKLMALISLSFKKIYKPTNNNLRTSSNTSCAIQDNSPRINKNDGYENQRIGNVAGARETSKLIGEMTLMMMNWKIRNWKRIIYMAQLQEVSPDAAVSGPIFDDEPLQKVSNADHYNVFAMENVHPEQSKYVHDTYPIEQDAQHVIIDLLDMSYDREEIDQNDDNNDLAKERELLASLIEKLKCEIDESKNRNKFLETSNKVLIEKLKGIANDIYFTVDACPNACEMWKAIERLKQVLTSTTTIMAKSQELKTVSYQKLYDILKQHQNEVNEIRAERLARTANLLALVTQQQPVYHPQNHPTHYTQNSSTRSQQDATENRGKAIVNSPPPIYDQEPSMVVEDDKMSKDKEIDKLMALISLSFNKIYKPTNNNLRTSSNTSRANQDNSLRIKRGTGYDNQRIGNVARARETVEQAGFQLSAEQAD
nr:hypothetical protein [Tanacetum cinerariifolium]